MFILLHPNMNELLSTASSKSNRMEVEGGEVQAPPAATFPLSCTYHRNSREEDYRKVFSEVSLKIVRVIQKLTLKRVDFFMRFDALEEEGMTGKAAAAAAVVASESIQSIAELKKVATGEDKSTNALELPFF